MLRPRLGRRGKQQSVGDISQQDADTSPAAEQDRQPNAGQPYAVYLSPNDRYLAIGHQQNWLTVYSLDGDRLDEILVERQVDPSTHVAWSPDGQQLAFVNSRGLGVVLGLPSGQSSIGLGLTNAIAFYPDGTQLAVLSAGQQLSVHSTGSPAAAPRIVARPSGKGSGAFAPNRHSMSRGHTLAVSPDGRWLAYSTPRCTVQIVEATNLTAFSELSGHTDVITGLEWLGPASLASCSLDGTIQIWQIDMHGELRLLEPGGSVLGMAYSPARDELESWTSDTHHIWSVATGEIRLQEPLGVTAHWSYPRFQYIAASRSGSLVVKLDGRSEAGHLIHPPRHRRDGSAGLGKHLCQRQGPAPRRFRGRQIWPCAEAGRRTVPPDRIDPCAPHLAHASARTERRDAEAARDPALGPSWSARIPDCASASSWRRRGGSYPLRLTK